MKNIGTKMNLSNFETLQLAKEYKIKSGRLASANIVNAFLAELKLYIPLKKIAATDGHIAQNEIAVFLDQKSTEYNFIIGDPVGDKQIALMDWLVSLGDQLNVVVGSETIDVADRIQLFKILAVTECNQYSHPFLASTEYDFGVAKGLFTKMIIQNDRGFVVLNYTKNTITHNPVVLAESPRTGKTEIAGVIRGVNLAGSYDCQISSKYNTCNLYVYNYGGVAV